PAPGWSRELASDAASLFSPTVRTGSVTIGWSRTLLTLLVDELQVKDRFFELIGDVRHLPIRQYPQAIAVAIALRHSWRPDDLAHLARRLRITLSVTALSRRPQIRSSNRPHTSAASTANPRARGNAGHHVRDSGARRRAVK